LLPVSLERRGCTGDRSPRVGEIAAERPAEKQAAAPEQPVEEQGGHASTQSSLN